MKKIVSLMLCILALAGLASVAMASPDQRPGLVLEKETLIPTTLTASALPSDTEALISKEIVPAWSNEWTIVQSENGMSAVSSAKEATTMESISAAGRMTTAAQGVLPATDIAAGSQSTTNKAFGPAAA